MGLLGSYLPLGESKSVNGFQKSGDFIYWQVQTTLASAEKGSGHHQNYIVYFNDVVAKIRYQPN